MQDRPADFTVQQSTNAAMSVAWAFIQQASDQVQQLGVLSFQVTLAQLSPYAVSER